MLSNDISHYSGLLKIRTPKNPDFCFFAKKFLSKKSGLLCFRRTSLVQNIRIFMIWPRLFSKKIRLKRNIFWVFLHKPSTRFRTGDFNILTSFSILKKSNLPKKSGLLLFQKTGLFLKIRTFRFSQKRTCPKNPDFHQKSLQMRVRILSTPLYMFWWISWPSQGSGESESEFD